MLYKLNLPKKSSNILNLVIYICNMHFVYRVVVEVLDTRVVGVVEGQGGFNSAGMDMLGRLIAGHLS